MCRGDKFAGKGEQREEGGGGKHGGSIYKVNFFSKGKDKKHRMQCIYWIYRSWVVSLSNGIQPLPNRVE